MISKFFAAKKLSRSTLEIELGEIEDRAMPLLSRGLVPILTLISINEIAKPASHIAITYPSFSFAVYLLLIFITMYLCATTIISILPR